MYEALVLEINDHIARGQYKDAEQKCGWASDGAYKDKNDRAGELFSGAQKALTRSDDKRARELLRQITELKREIKEANFGRDLRRAFGFG